MVRRSRGQRSTRGGGSLRGAASRAVSVVSGAARGAASGGVVGAVGGGIRALVGGRGGSRSVRRRSRGVNLNRYAKRLIKAKLDAKLMSIKMRAVNAIK